MHSNEGADLQRWLDQQNMTKKDLAERIGVFPSAVSYWVKQKKIPNKYRGALQQLGFNLKVFRSMTEGDGQRLKAYFTKHSILVKDAALKIGVHSQYLTNSFSKAKFSASFMQKINAAGYVLEQSSTMQPSVEYGNSKIKKSKIVYGHDYGAYLQGFNDENYLMTLYEHTIYFDEPGTYRTFEIVGDSMEPDFPQGCLVDGKLLETELWNKLQIGRIYIIAHAEFGLQIKLLIKQDGTQCVFRSINAFYKDFNVDLPDVRELWYFVQKHDVNRDYSRYLVR